MTLLLQICAVIVTMAIVAIAISLVRGMVKFEKATENLSELTESTQAWMAEVNQVAREARDLVVSLRDVVPPVRRVADRFEALGKRSARLSAAVLDEVEGPIRTGVAVARGVRLGTTYFLERLTQRVKRGRSATDGGTGS